MYTLYLSSRQAVTNVRKNAFELLSFEEKKRQNICRLSFEVNVGTYIYVFKTFNCKTNKIPRNILMFLGVQPFVCFAISRLRPVGQTHTDLKHITQAHVRSQGEQTKGYASLDFCKNTLLPIKGESYRNHNRSETLSLDADVKALKNQYKFF